MRTLPCTAWSGTSWFDRAQDRYVYNIEDADSPLLSADAGVDSATEIDPTQKTAYVDEHVGREHTLVVLSADHGAAEVPAYLRERGIPAQYLDLDAVDREPRFAALRERFGLGKEIVASYQHPYLNLDHDAIAEKGLDLVDVARAVAEQAELFDE